MFLSQIVAVAENNVIGKNNTLVWHMPADMKYFMEKTKGHCIITGRKNYESIPEKYRPLSGRTNIVVTRQQNYNAPGALVVSTLEDAIEKAKSRGENETFIIGGAEIYKQTLPLTDKIYFTRIHHAFEGDAHFPELDFSLWKEESVIHHKADEKNPYDFSFYVYTKKKQENN